MHNALTAPAFADAALKALLPVFADHQQRCDNPEGVLCHGEDEDELNHLNASLFGGGTIRPTMVSAFPWRSRTSRTCSIIYEGSKSLRMQVSGDGCDVSCIQGGCRDR